MTADPLALSMAVLTGCVGLAAWPGSRRGGRMFGLLGILCLLAALLAASAIVAAVAVEAAVLAASWLMRGWSPAAGRRLLLVGGTAAALALTGTLLVAGAVGSAGWRDLAVADPEADTARLGVGFVLALAGYGTVAALLPPFAWLPRALARAPAPSAILLAGALPIAPLVLLLRLRGVLAAHPGGLPPGPLLIAAGLVAIFWSAFALGRGRGSARRLVGLATIGQSGVAAFAFGLGGPAATFAGLLHLVLGTLGRIAVMRDVASEPRALRLSALLALSGLPPFGPFPSLVLVVAATAQRAPWLLLPLLPAVAAGMLASLGRLPALFMTGAGCDEPATALPNRHGRDKPDKPDHDGEDASAAPHPLTSTLRLAPAWLLLAVAAVLGLAMPASVAAFLRAAAAAVR